MTTLGPKRKWSGETEKVKTPRFGILFLKHVLHHLIVAAALGIKINFKMLKKLLVSNICHTEIMIYMRKNNIVNILGQKYEKQHAHIWFYLNV